MEAPVPGLSKELLQDSEVTLRLVDDLVAELSDKDDAVNAGMRTLLERLAERRAEVRGVEHFLVRMYAELQRILYSVRKSRGLLEEAAISHLESTNAKLREVSSATEFAATNMLDGVDRALAFVDRIEEEPSPEDFDGLRDELHALVVALQFQDITSQQLEHASSIIADLEKQLRQVTRVFGSIVLQEVDEDDDGDFFAQATGAFDPQASVSDATTRQAVADDIFGPT